MKGFALCLLLYFVLNGNGVHSGLVHEPLLEGTNGDAMEELAARANVIQLVGWSFSVT